MQKAWEEFRQTTDPLAVWLDRITVEGPGAWVGKDGLLNACNREGEGQQAEPHEAGHDPAEGELTPA